MTVSDEKFQPVAKLIIGYKTKLNPTVGSYLPEFKAPANYKDAAKIAAEVAERKQEFLASAASMPYVGTFDEVFVADMQKHRSVQWKCAAPDEEKPSVATRVRSYLLKHYPDAWDNNVIQRKIPKVLFIGFEIKTFLKLLGIECALPATNKPCPLSLWYGNSDHRDISEAILPKEACKGLTLAYVLKFWRPTFDAESTKTWDGLIKDWHSPGENPTKDAGIASVIATQIGLV